MSRWNRFAPLSGVLAVGLWIVGIIVVNHNSPADHATDQQILDYYKSNENWVLLGGWLFILGCLAFIWFAAVLRERLLAAEGTAAGTTTTIAFVGAVAAAIFGMLVPSPDIAAAINKDDISAATAGALHNSTDAFFVCAELAAVLLFVGAAVLAFRTKVLSKWWAVLMVLVAVVLVIGPIGWAGLIFGLPVWTLGTSVMLLRSGGARPTEAVPATG
jgi:hypothetical protein